MKFWMTVIGTAIISITSIAHSQTTIQPKGYGSVTGLVLFAGYPKQGIDFQIYSIRSGVRSAVAVTNANGVLHFNKIPAGSYLMYFWLRSRPSYYLSTYITVKNNAVTVLPTINIASDFSVFTTIGDPKPFFDFN